MAKLLEFDPKKRFRLYMLQEGNRYFDPKICEYLKVSSEDLMVY